MDNLGIADLAFSNSTSQVDCYIDYVSSNTFSFNYMFEVSTTTRVYTLRNSYLGWDSTITYLNLGWLQTSKSCFIVDMNVVSSGFNYRKETIPTTLNNGRLDLSHTNIIVLVFSGFSVQSSSGAFSQAISNIITSSTTYNATISVNGTTLLYQVAWDRLLFDETDIESYMENFFDLGTTKGSNNNQVTWPSILSVQNLFIGITSFSFSATSQPSFSIQTSSPFNIQAANGYLILEFFYINIRMRNCSSPSPLYRLTSQLCYSTCPSYTYTDVTSQACR